jgi:NAD(P)-dependent dehydrogenase (short-subunit alcohol dehydrogenase family)
MTETISDSDLLRPLRAKTALVTGGGRGLGAAISRRLDRAGARVAVVGRSKPALDTVVSQSHNDAMAVAADLSADDEPARVLDLVLRAFGRLDVLVSNAGAGHSGPSDELTVEDLDRVWALNVRAALLLQGRAAAHMARAGGGSIVSLSSALSGLGNTYSSLYAATKGALDAATRSLAAEWGPRGVRVNAVRPGVTRSDLSAAIVNNAALRANYEQQVPLRRAGEPGDVAETVLFLSSPQASYITGQTINVDGGWTTTKPSIAGLDTPAD